MLFTIAPESWVAFAESAFMAGGLLVHAERIAKAAKVRDLFIIVNLDE
jgi:hypothetical protein